eukprot:gnl/MRDRNA2_/MRDRNA2_114730_c0_seq1.p1 gnl/MRDRNA2_/MRDRNA2_114730_c0~~gnl/MRDRNA2_/MRDRNA2_114730_c0_seq1.p1  ORF type:complete len:474 (-),score=100.10 gnl/MRDRNA2_/MRDRNA2_114730_c0_seq1:92-1513(-)
MSDVRSNLNSDPVTMANGGYPNGDGTVDAEANARGCPDDLDEWVPSSQRAGTYRPGKGDAWEEVSQWSLENERQIAKAKAEANQGMFDFDDMPDEPIALKPRERMAPQNGTEQQAIEWAAWAEQDLLKGRPKTARQMIKDALKEELAIIPLGDPRRRQACQKAHAELALAPKDPLPERMERRRLGKMLVTMTKPPPSDAFGPRTGPDGKIMPPDPHIRIREKEAIEMVERGAELDMQIGDLKHWPLHSAAEHAYPRLISVMLDHGARVNAADHAGCTALHFTAYSGKWCDAPPPDRHDVIDVLCVRKADINFATARGRTPLHIAALEGDGDMCSAFIRNGADVNAIDLGGFTPLMWACGHGYKYNVHKLLDAKASMAIQGHRGQTALMYALTNELDEIADVLHERQALLDRNARGAAARKESALEDGQATEEDAKPLNSPEVEVKGTLYPPYMGRVREDYLPDLTSNVYNIEK